MNEQVNYLDPHYSFAALLISFAPPIAFAIGLTTLGIAGLQVIPQINMACSVVAVSGLFVFAVTFRTFIYAQDKLRIMYDCWQDGQANSQKIALMTVENERERIMYQVNVSGRGTANIGTGTQNNLTVEAPNREQEKFVEHYTEFIRIAAAMRRINAGDTGFERKHFRQDAGAVSNYRFSDGSELSRGEYDRLCKLAQAQGIAPDDRRKGSAGHLTIIDQPPYPAIENG